MNLFWRDYAGMDQLDVSISQAAFTVIMIVLDIPMGWLADVFSRKWANIFGDVVYGLGFILYAFSTSLGWVIAAEVILAIGLAASSGADGPLMEEYCKKLGLDYKKEQVKLQRWAPLVMAGAMAVGGIIGTLNPRLAIIIGGLPPLIGALSMLWAVEDKRPHIHHKKQPWQDFKAVIHYCFHGHRELAATIWAKTVLNESTHTIVWVTTPILITSGIPPWLVGIGWAANNVGASIGAVLANRFGTDMPTIRAYSIPLVVLVVACLTLGLRPSLVTATGFIIFGAVKGWQIAIMPAKVQLLAPEHIKTSVNSVSSTLSRLVYIPLVLVVGQAGKVVPQYALLVNAAIFTVLGTMVFPFLRKHT